MLESFECVRVLAHKQSLTGLPFRIAARKIDFCDGVTSSASFFPYRGDVPRSFSLWLVLLPGRLASVFGASLARIIRET